jgi:hypothetical protein
MMERGNGTSRLIYQEQRHGTMERYGEVKVQLHNSLPQHYMNVRDWFDYPCPITSVETLPGTHCIKSERYDFRFSLRWLRSKPSSGIKNPVPTSEGTNYVSATEPNRLMLCKIWGFHGGDYEECRILGHKNPVRTSRETHYVSVTEPSRLILCKICGFHGGDYEEFRLRGCDAVWLL